MTPMDRRTFLRTASLGTAAGILLPDRLLANAAGGRARWLADPVRVRGRVVAGSRGVAGAVVSDGLTTAAADAEGYFELISDRSRRWVSLTLPSGHRVPVSETGTARLHTPLSPNGRGEMDAPFRVEARRESDEDHSFLVLADPQTQTDWEMSRFHDETVPDVRATLAGLDGPVFGVACGDIMYDELSLYPDYERAVAAMGLPFFQVVGNHDLDFEGPTDQTSTLTFQEYFGPANYSFDVGGIHYVVLDDVFWQGAGYLPYLPEDTLTWLASDLSHVEAGRTVAAFLHIPVLSTGYLRAGEPRPDTGGAVTNRDALYRLLEPYTVHVMAGHTHEADHYRHGGLSEHVNGAVCGAWWTGDICHDGTPNGYTVYRASGESLSWRYKATGHPDEHQIRVYSPGADPAAPDELVANVWFADEDWSVALYQDGERRPMARRTGRDPLSVALLAGPRIPTHRPYVEPQLTRHLYYAPVDPAAADLVVEATDPFGRTFTARPETAAVG